MPINDKLISGPKILHALESSVSDMVLTSITDNLSVEEFVRLPPPIAVKSNAPITGKASNTVTLNRLMVDDVLKQKDDRFLVIVGPCSIHDREGAMEYAHKLARLRGELEDRLLIVMRVYFEKPRSTIGWKGLINDPRMDGSCDIREGIRIARRLLLDINELGLPAATEFLDPIVPQYISDLVAWAAIGARTTESQTHREMASGLSMPVGFKNGTDGSLQIAIDAMRSSSAPHSFVGIDDEGFTSIVRTRGNSRGHIILRGGNKRTNYDAESIREASSRLLQNGLPNILMVDCSHANSQKQHKKQEDVWNSILEQRVAGNRPIIGAMVESYLREGNQPMSDRKALIRGVSVTDACVGWETTERMLRYAHQALREAKVAA